MPAILIREINSQDIDIYKSFFIKALINDEESFRITPQDDANAPFPTSDKEDSFTLGAFDENRLIGVVSFAREGMNREKLRHKGLLFRMVVSETYRGLGIAKNLIYEVIGRVQNIPDIEQINLTVISNNANATGLYKRFGFVAFGAEENAIKWKNKYLTEDQMVLKLRGR